MLCFTRSNQSLDRYAGARLLGRTPKRTQRAYILVGSPNMTFAALLAPATQCNIEAAWIFNERWEDARRLLRTIGSKGRSINDAEFVAPSVNRVNAWMPLRHATYDPLHHTLRLEWRNPAMLVAQFFVTRVAHSPSTMRHASSRSGSSIPSAG